MIITSDELLKYHHGFKGHKQIKEYIITNGDWILEEEDIQEGEDDMGMKGEGFKEVDDETKKEDDITIEYNDTGNTSDRMTEESRYTNDDEGINIEHNLQFRKYNQPASRNFGFILDVENLSPGYNEDTEDYVKQQEIHHKKFLEEIRSKGLTLKDGESSSALVHRLEEYRAQQKEATNFSEESEYQGGGLNY
ncbi:hypothetical protein CLIB1444_13S02300 [[Candida] jaroonii]|uniref:Uncharacterized protein n=1 Tax=[Candida] jaroonii TaxID=467808 RepID=A0ACA9YEP9_9ASCO|nr:hypothetical protein CLIB1444_13S02300 [[Candida] jaroonii]